MELAIDLGAEYEYQGFEYGFCAAVNWMADRMKNLDMNMEG